MATCRECGQTIHFIESKTGKYMPCDMERVSAYECEDGDKLVTLDGEVVTVRAGIDAEGYVCHFSTCPDAEKFRKKK